MGWVYAFCFLFTLVVFVVNMGLFFAIRRRLQKERELLNSLHEVRHRIQLEAEVLNEIAQKVGKDVLADYRRYRRFYYGGDHEA